MKKLIYVWITCSLLFTLFTPHMYASKKELKAECTEKLEIEKEKFHARVMEDVLVSYQINPENEEMISYDIEDLRKISLLTRKDETHLESILQQFESISLGKKQLFFLNNDLNTAYLLYKDQNYNNIMVQLARGETKWEVIESKVKEGKEIKFNKENCKEEHIINKGFNGLFNGLD